MVTNNEVNRKSLVKVNGLIVKDFPTENQYVESILIESDRLPSYVFFL